MALPNNADIPLILSRIRAGADWGWKGGSLADPANLDWRDVAQVLPTELEFDSGWAAFLAEEGAQAALRSQIKNDTASTEGVLLSNLTNAEVRQLLEVVLYVFGGIDRNTREIKPVNQWVQAKEVFQL